MRYYIYNQPMPGLAKNGKRVTANELVIVSEKDVIQMRRQLETQMRTIGESNDEHRLQDFKAVHWAAEVNSIEELLETLKTMVKEDEARSAIMEDLCKD